MTTDQYYELMDELNFNDSSVGQYPITLNDTETISDILTQFNYIPIGQYETRNKAGFKFKDDKETYSIHQEKDQLKIYKLIEL